MGVVAWFFAEDESGEMKRVARTRVDRFLNGFDTLPIGPDLRHVRAAELVLGVSGRHVQRVHRVPWPQWAVAADGRCDPGVWEAYARLAVQLITYTDPRDGVVPLGPALARRDISDNYEWTPSEAQLHEVARQVNAKASMPPVVAITVDGLLPI